MNKKTINGIVYERKSAHGRWIPVGRADVVERVETLTRETAKLKREKKDLLTKIKPELPDKTP